MENKCMGKISKKEKKENTKKVRAGQGKLAL